MSIVLQSSGGGQITLLEPTTASNFTQTLPAGTGTTVVNGVNGSIVAGTAVASTSGTSIDFTSIPSWVKRVTVMYTSLQISGSSNVMFQLGTSGGIQTSGYLGSSSFTGGGFNGSTYTTGFGINSTGSSNVMNGQIVFSLLNSASGIWAASGVTGLSNIGYTQATAGSKTLSGTLDRIRITTVNGTDTFTSGSINILYE